MDPTVDLIVVNDCVDEAVELCDAFESAGLTTAVSLGPVAAAQMLRTHRPRLVLMASARLAGDDAGAVLQWLREGIDNVVFGCLVDAQTSKGASYFRAMGFDFCLRLPLPAATINALVESVNAVRLRFGSAPAVGSMTVERSTSATGTAVR